MADTKNRLTIEEAEQQIREIVKLGDIIYSDHCYSNSMKTRNYDEQDVEFILSTGTVIGPPKYSKKFDSWKCMVKGSFIDGEPATVVVAIMNHRTLQCITVMDK